MLRAGQHGIARSGAGSDGGGLVSVRREFSRWEAQHEQSGDHQAPASALWIFSHPVRIFAAVGWALSLSFSFVHKVVPFLNWIRVEFTENAPFAGNSQCTNSPRQIVRFRNVEGHRRCNEWEFCG